MLTGVSPCGGTSIAKPLSTTLYLHPRAFRCPGGPLSPWDVHVRGRTNGRRIHVDIATCLTPQVRLIRLLGITTNQLLQVIDADH